MKTRILGHRLRQGAGEYRRRQGPPDELAGRVESDLRYRVDVDGLEVRAVDGAADLRSVVGHAAVFDRMSEELGVPGMSFRERIRRGAFRKALDEGQDVAFLIEHDTRWLMARTSSGTLELSEDPRGLRVFSRLDTRQSYVADLVVAMERRDLTQMSFGFQAGEDEWLERRLDDGTVEVVRDVIEVRRLFDVSAVTFPAYPQTDLSLRSAVAAVLDAADVDLDTLRRLAAAIHTGEQEVTADERDLIDLALLRADEVSPWVMERALRASSREPEREAIPSGTGDPSDDAPPVGEPVHPALAARRRRLQFLTS